MSPKFRLPLFILSALVSSTLFFSCDNDEDLGPPPSVDFSADRKVGELNETINFSNSSTIDNNTPLKYEWDFGDGTISTSARPSKKYSATGKFPVTLTAISDDGQRISKTDTITIGKRYLTGIVIADLSFTKVIDNAGTEAPWDTDNSGPDLLVLFGRTFAQDWDFENSNNIIANVVEDDLPVGFNFSGSNYILDEDFYDLYVLDSDGENAEPMILLQGFEGTSRTDTYHFTASDNINLGKDPETGEGILAFVNQYVFVFLSFEIR